ncbi:hypothetical protein [Jiulongibacter sp. NS-SX5]|uniref:hypothetical protein n=1 Tax=Jiulongibacter sp. NS-SX5 TaxID=3463854 RepID=UPI004059E5DF
MKKLILFLFFSPFLFTACNPDGVDARADTFQVNIDGDKFVIRGTDAYSFGFSDGSFNVYGLSEDITVYVGFETGITEGSYPISDDVYVYVIYENGGPSYSSLVEGSSGTVELVQKSESIIKGNFDVVVTNFDDPSDKLTLSAGSFNVNHF